jgi:hypothetical protein
VRYELDFYTLFRRNSVFKGLMRNCFLFNVDHRVNFSSSSRRVSAEKVIRICTDILDKNALKILLNPLMIHVIMNMDFA